MVQKKATITIMKLSHVFHMVDFLFVFHGFVAFLGDTLSDFLVYNISINRKANLTNSVKLQSSHNVKMYNMHREFIP